MEIKLINRMNNMSFPELKTEDIKKCSGKKFMKKDEKALHEACRGFESIFLESMLKSMRKTIPEDKLFGDGNGMDIYTSMHDQYLARNISEDGRGIGLEDFLYRQISRSG